MRVPPKPSEIVEAYIDESSQNNHRYLVLGTTAVMMDDTQQVIQLLETARTPELPKGEAKWTKVSKRKLVAYKRIVDVLFNNPDLVHFHSLVVDTTLLNDRRYNFGSREIGFNKEIYQLAMKLSRLYPSQLFHVYPDYRETTQKPEDLRLILNRACQKKGDKRDWPFRRCQFRDSKKTLPLQLVDIVVGGLAYHMNEHHREAGASPAKCDLSSYILARAGIEDASKDTAPAAKFTIWHRKLR
jgi:Protein of unknown function (DUF3800)